MKLSDKVEIIKGVASRNRIMLPAMDTLMSDDGLVNDFHIQHYGARAFGGTGTIIVESTAVSPEGKIRDKDLGIWNDEQIEGLARVAKISKQAGAVIGVQINHAGAKAELTDIETISTTEFFDYIERKELRLINEDELPRIENDFVEAARRVKEAGFDFVEIHAAHGYLLNQIMHPVLNTRFGSGVLDKGQILINIAKRIKEEINIPVGIRFSFDDHDPKGVTVNYWTPLLKELDPYVTYYNVSSGETISKARTDEIIKKAGTKLFRIPIIEELKKVTDVNLISAGNISTKEDALAVMNAGAAGVAIGREQIFNPNLTVSEMVDVEDMDPEAYHWNKNLWYSHPQYLGLMKKLGLK